MEQVTIKPWGNSQGIRISKEILDNLNLKVNDTLQIKTSDDSIILKKAFRHKSFKERLAEYDGKISVIDYEWGNPVGKELL